MDTGPRSLGRLLGTTALAGLLAVTMTACGGEAGSPGTTAAPTVAESTSAAQTPEETSTSMEPTTPPSDDSSSSPAAPAPAPSESSPASPPSSTAPRTTPPPASPPPAAGGQLSATLTVSIRQSADASPQEYILECTDGAISPATTLPNPAGACAALSQVGEQVFFTPPNLTRQCTQEYGGPQTAIITGTLNGQPVNKAFSLTDGCEISLWNSMEPILGRAGAV